MTLPFNKPTDDANRTQVTYQPYLASFMWLMRVLVVASLLIVLINIPTFYVDVINRVRASGALTEAGIPPELIALLRSIIRRFGELCFFGIAIGVMTRSRNPLAILLGMTCAVLAPTLSGSVIEVEQAYPTLALPIRIFTELSISLGTLLMFTLPNGEFVPRWSRYLLIVLTVLDSVRLTLYSYAPNPILFIPVICVYAVAIWAQVLRYRRESSVYQHQFKWVILGASASLLSIIIGQICNLVVPRDFHVLTQGIDEIGSIILAVCMIFAVTRYRLYDINLFIHRTVIYWLVFVALTLLFVAQFFILRGILDALLQQPNHPLSIIVPLLVSALLFNPLRTRIQTLIDRRVYHFRFDLDQLERAQQPLEIKYPGQYTGKIIGGFELRDVIGKGGMGEVYKGVQNGKSAAVKVMDHVWEFDTQVRQRFEREGKLTAALNHPRIVKTYSYGENDGIYYVALEFIDGKSLSQLLHEQTRLSLEDLVPMFQQMAEAVGYIHEQGYVHRDLKPANIMLRLSADKETYEPILMDFGIAKLMTDSIPDELAVGTIHYMAPEQIQASEKVDQQADIYSLGVMLYELLTGIPPFTGGIGQILFAHLSQPPPNPCDQLPELPPQVGYVVQRALSKDPKDRFPSAQEMSETLRLACEISTT
jgi:hypothetical protein